jgi:poly-beta-1,6-N-acetyl-D-glucosamine synthase
MIIAGGVLGLIYFVFIIAVIFGWFKLNKNNYKKTISEPISIIVAARNEEDNIVSLLKCLQNQTYNKYEIIIIDDHSTDNTSINIKKIVAENFSHSILYYKLPDYLKGKKSALNYGISKANYSIICTTDADCTMPERWLQTMVSYLHSNASMVVGPVTFNISNKVLTNLFTLEFLSLVGTGAGTIGLNKAIFCNGANLCFRKSIFSNINDNYNSEITSGDDVFLLHSVKKQRKSIVFAKSQSAIVNTKSPITIVDFVNQRIRWASKSKHYTDADTIQVGILIFVVSVFIIMLGVLSFFDTYYINIFLYSILVKTVIDTLFFIPVLFFFNRIKLLLFVLPLQLFYVAYIFTIGIISPFSSINWKGRKYSR